MASLGDPAAGRARPRYLWLAGVCPHPIDGGMTSYSAGLSESLAATGAEVVGIGLDPGRPPTAGMPAPAVRWTRVGGRRRSQAASLLSPLPNIAHSYALPAFRAALEGALAGGRWDAVIVEHLQMGWAHDLVHRWRADTGAPTALVHVSQNHETTVRREIAASTPLSPRGLALRLDAAKIARLERRVVRESDLVTSITPADDELFARDGDAARVVVEPGYSGSRVPHRTIGPEVPRRVVIVGNLEWHVKRSNLDRFVAAADAPFAAAGIELLVIGKAPEAYVRERAARLRATRFVGFVPDLEATLAESRMGIVSEPNGGGFKLKSLDYVFHRLPIAVLDGSVSGLPLVPGEGYLGFPDEASLAAGVVAAIDDLDLLDRLQENAYRASADAFSWEERGHRLRAAIDGARGSGPPGGQGYSGSAVNPMTTRE
ncbi:MAG: glycosyltransferase [Acidimicrobiia bacterium]